MYPLSHNTYIDSITVLFFGIFCILYCLWANVSYGYTYRPHTCQNHSLWNEWYINRSFTFESIQQHHCKNRICITFNPGTPLHKVFDIIPYGIFAILFFWPRPCFQSCYHDILFHLSLAQYEMTTLITVHLCLHIHNHHEFYIPW